jgi:hypothetical protein
MGHVESTASMAWNLPSSSLSPDRIILLSTPSSLATVHLLYLHSSARHHHYWSLSSYYHYCSSPCASPLSWKWALLSLYLPPLLFALIVYTETKSELPARCTKAAMVDLWARVCHHSERCRPSLLQWVHGWVHPDGWSSLIDSPSETRSSSPGGIISITWCPSDASTMDISYPPFLYVVFFTIPIDIAFYIVLLLLLPSG